MTLQRFAFLFLTLLLASCGPKIDSATEAAQATEAATHSPVQNEATDTVTPSTTEQIFRPAQGTLWQWQLDTPIDMSVDAQVYDIDLFENDVSVVAALHAKGAKVICYTSVGSFEDWRPDAGQFPKEVIGKDYPGWPGEKFLDIRQIDKLAPAMLARLDLCKQKGFDGIEPDNIENFNTDTGFPLSYEDQLKYNRWLAKEAHARGLSIGMKNDGDQVADLVNNFDWALLEDCFDQGWCEQFKPFLDAGKQVVDTEYTDTGITLDEFCLRAKTLGIDVIFKERDLTAFRKTCL